MTDKAFWNRISLEYESFEDYENVVSELLKDELCRDDYEASGTALEAIQEALAVTY